ncbi:hypothetical protein VTK26DRAFT_7888 [Humicola hyalothermophila]
MKAEPDDGLDLGPAHATYTKSEPEDETRHDANDANYLKRLTLSDDPDLLEKGVAVGVGILQRLKDRLAIAADIPTTQAPQWIQAIGNLEAEAKPTRTIVGVVGNTGAGKSSVISAVLDEERLLPTNCMRACTASPTEISYNYSDDPAELYRAEVEFITAQDWLSDLRALYSDLLDGSGEVARECTNQDSDAGVAYAKIKAVYPKLTREMIASASVEDLVDQPLVRRVLGSVRKLQARTAADLYRQLQEYVDSKEKNTEKRMEYWPLIKIVRIYTKAAALATGACLVDLPGVQDSNAARAAVADSYMKACTGLWIVAPITRAVDDKTAKSLLGDSFRRQLKYDGAYSAVTFICSKTDDISVTEAAESLGIDEEISESWGRIQEITDEIRKWKSRIAALKDERDACDDLVEGIEQAWDTWEALGGDLADGKTVYAPSDNAGRKRKRHSRPIGSRKNRVSSDLDDSNLSDSDASGSRDKENHESRNESREPLTEDQIDAKLASLKAEKKELRIKKKDIERQVSAIREEIKKLAEEKDELLAGVKAVCIQGRNEYSRRAIKQDFAMGVKELDQENAAEADEASFDPEVDIRDYDAVAESLPVFCVSSRAFQKLSGRLQKDDFDAGGFQSVEDTEIPQLQAHAQKLTEAGRAASSRRFLNNLVQLINSMSMWASDDGTRSTLTDAEKNQEETRLRKQLIKMEQELEFTLTECVQSIRKTLTDNIYENFDRYIPAAVDEAVKTATDWGAPKALGGLVWSTYKATCRRNGIFAGSAGPRDLNDELFSPISRHLASGWERAFQRRFPACPDNFIRAVRTLLQTFHREATERARERGTNYTGLGMLAQQLEAHSHRLTDIRVAIMTMTQELQRECNRGFTPAIQWEMMPAYQGCVEERGPGSFMRMKNIMVGHVTNRRQRMFHNATDGVTQQLDGLCNQVKAEMEAHMQELHTRLSHDYLAVLVGTDVASMQMGVPRVELMLRAEMAPVLAEFESGFCRTVWGRCHQEERRGWICGWWGG